eukprot:TRINITY_DN9041_c0_g1_i3.p1 TRINITY_DN9041_c0_g1~~TRINITY_DN9041_c0_g1_i3.p1  ORF type:complete len:483 (-),score=67.67 TRINITY_DN9041_c0_g1_i3:370-1818(-)
MFKFSTTQCHKQSCFPNGLSKRYVKYRFCASSTQVPQQSVNYQQLSRWFTQEGGQLNQDIEITEEGFLLAKNEIEKNAEIVVVPENLWISSAVAKQYFGGAVDKLEGWLQVALFLLAGNKGLIKDSVWNTYFQTLLEQPRSTVFWSEEELKELQGSQILANSIGYKQFFKQKFEDLQKTVFSQQRQLFPEDAFNEKNVSWSIGTIRSRVHAPLNKEKFAIVPIADMVCHSRIGNCQWAVKSVGLFGGSKQLCVTSTSTISKGDLVSMDFDSDALENQILLNYGQYDCQNQKAGFNLTLELPQSDRNFDDKEDILSTADLGTSQNFRLAAQQAPTETMLGFFRLINLSGADSFLLEALFRNEAWSHMCVPVSEENERASIASAVNGCKQALEGYSTSISQDLSILDTQNLKPRSKMQLAVQARLDEKEALDSTLQFFESMKDKVSQMTYYQERRLQRLGLMDEEGKSTYDFDDYFKDGITGSR